jgi:hypothetical protein
MQHAYEASQLMPVMLRSTLTNLVTCAVPSVLQLLGENLFNPPGLDIVFTDTQSLRLSDATKAALSIAPYKPSVAVPFASWSTPVETPSGELANEVPFDRNGVARQQGNILPGELCRNCSCRLASATQFVTRFVGLTPPCTTLLAFTTTACR